VILGVSERITALMTIRISIGRETVKSKSTAGPLNGKAVTNLRDEAPHGGLQRRRNRLRRTVDKRTKRGEEAIGEEEAELINSYSPLLSTQTVCKREFSVFETAGIVCRSKSSITPPHSLTSDRN
jgi:hypothetical protein